MKYTKPFGLIFIILLLDQAIKIYVKTHFLLGEQVSMAGDWFYIHFTENNGMAFGMELAGQTGKLLLSSFRIIAIGFLGYLLVNLIKKNSDNMLIISLSLIFAGAFGNILDSCFYGIIFDESLNNLATMFPPDGGYSSFLFGRVVDMFYFPLIEGHFPSWSPLWANEEFIFFRPVFNLADASISTGVGLMLLFQKRFFGEALK